MFKSIAVSLLLLPTHAFAWTFSPTPICTLSFAGEDMDVTVTYDASLPEYALLLTRADGWPDAPVFSLRFEGPRGLTISTGRHSVDGETLAARDTGFGNVLNGLEFNTRAVAILGDLEVPVALDGINPAMTQFRACPVAQLS